MKKTIIAALASLMLAGAISAASGENLSASTKVAVIVGEGGSPIPVVPPSSPVSDGHPDN